MRTHMSIEERLTKVVRLVPGLIVHAMSCGEALVIEDAYYPKHSAEEGDVALVSTADIHLHRDPDEIHRERLFDITILADIRNIGHLLEQVRGKFSCRTAWVRMWPAAGIDMSGQDRTRYEVCDGLGRRLVPGERLPAYSAMEALLHALEYKDE